MKTGYRVLKATRSRQPQSTVSYTAGTIGEVNETQAEIVWDDKEVTVSLNIEENDLFLLDNAASGKPRYCCKYNISPAYTYRRHALGNVIVVPTTE